MKSLIILSVLLVFTFQKTLIDEMNSVRTDPSGYTKTLQTYNNSNYPWNKTQINDAVQNLTAAKPIVALKESKCLDNSSQTQATYDETEGKATYTGPKGNTGADRINEVVNASKASWSGVYDEHIQYMTTANYTPEDVVVEWLVYGNTSATGLLNPEFLYAGFGEAANYVVIDFATNITC